MFTPRIIRVEEDPDFQALVRYSRRSNWLTVVLECAGFLSISLSIIMTALGVLAFFGDAHPEVVSKIFSAVNITTWTGIAILFLSWLVGRIKELLLIRKEKTDSGGR